MIRRSLWSALALAALSAIAACEDVGSHDPIEIQANSRIRGILFLDLNGSAQYDAGDQTMRGWVVRLLGSNGGLLASTVSDSTGAFAFDVDASRVTLDVERARLGDTLQVFGLAVGREVTLLRDDSLIVSVGFTYPSVSLAAVDSLPLGRRVFVEGIALTNVTTNGPRELHLRAGSDAVRVTSIVRKPLAPGDSVRVLARRATEAGQPILTGGEITLIRPSVADAEPIDLTTRAASTAQQGAVAAELARIRNADLVRSRNEQSDVILTVDDGTGSLEIQLRSFLGADASFFNADSVRVLSATGLLVPYLNEAGQPRWRLATRAALDLRLEAERRPNPVVPASMR